VEGERGREILTTFPRHWKNTIRDFASISSLFPIFLYFPLSPSLMFSLPFSFSVPPSFFPLPSVSVVSHSLIPSSPHSLSILCVLSFPLFLSLSPSFPYHPSFPLNHLVPSPYLNV
jgi:hypothetical protein